MFLCTVIKVVGRRGRTNGNKGDGEDAGSSSPPTSPPPSPRSLSPSLARCFIDAHNPRVDPENKLTPTCRVARKSFDPPQGSCGARKSRSDQLDEPHRRGARIQLLREGFIYFCLFVFHSSPLLQLNRSRFHVSRKRVGDVFFLSPLKTYTADTKGESGRALRFSPAFSPRGNVDCFAVISAELKQVGSSGLLVMVKGKKRRNRSPFHPPHRASLCALAALFFLSCVRIERGCKRLPVTCVH